jgi:hypothetical protein
MDEGSTKDAINSGDYESLFNYITSFAMPSEDGVNHYIDRYKNKIDIYRVYDKNDIVPKLLPPARHLGKPIQYGDKLNYKDLINKDKMWKIHWMQNYKSQIENNKPQNPNAGANLLMDLIKN